MISKFSVYSQDLSESALLGAMHTIASQDMLDYFKTQCKEKYERRLHGTKGYPGCAKWLSEEFTQWGLVVAGDKGSWFQWFDTSFTSCYSTVQLLFEYSCKNSSTLIKQYRYISGYMLNGVAHPWIILGRHVVMPSGTGLPG